MKDESDIATLTREELYNLVWEQPMSEIKRKYYTFGSDVKDYCSKMDIPMPKPSYWKMQEMGVSPQRIALPPTKKKTNLIELRLLNPGKLEIFPPLETLAEEIELALEDTLNVSKHINDLHDLVWRAKYHLEGLKQTGGILRTDYQHLEIKTSAERLMDCIGFYNCLVKGLESRGHAIEVRTQIRARGTFAIVHGESIRILVTETSSTPLGYVRSVANSSPTGTIKVELGNVKTFYSYYELEFELSRCLARIELEALARKARRNDHASLTKIQSDQSKYSQCKRELTDFKLLIEKAERWKAANTMREYLNYIAQEAQDKVDVSSELSHWISWANKKIEWYDPAIEREDDIFEMVDRSKLEIKTIDGRFIKD